MITIKCNKCGLENSNGYQFKQKHFHFIADNTNHPNIHLCGSCQSDLRLVIDETIAKFMGVENVCGWVESKGIMP